MKEVLKHLRAENIKMIILAVNIEEVDAQDGLDDYILSIIQTCRELKVPLIYSLTRYKLGFVGKFQGQFVSIIGIRNFLGANDEFNMLIEKGRSARKEFYTRLRNSMEEFDLALLRKENKFLDWQLFDKIKSESKVN